MQSLLEYFVNGRRAAIGSACAMALSLVASGAAQAQTTITLPQPSCVPIPGQTVNIGGLFAGSGLIQNFGAAALVLNCNLVRTAGLQVAAVQIDALAPGATPLTARLTAVSTPLGQNSTTLRFVNLRSVQRQGFQRIVGGGFAMPLTNDSGTFLRVSPAQGQILSRIALRQAANPLGPPL